jgi:DNA polymerase III epsilon subunit-like protein
MHFIVIDCETTGLVKTTNGEYPLYSEEWKYKFARMIQFSWYRTTCFENLSINKVNDYYRKITDDDYFRIFNHKFHGITNKICNESGLEMKNIIEKFIKDFDKSDIIVGYNIHFDLAILKYELYKLKRVDLIEKIVWFVKNNKILCLGSEGKLNMGIENYPKFTTFYKYKFGVEPKNCHNSKYDTFYTTKLLKRCIKDKIHNNLKISNLTFSL